MSSQLRVGECVGDVVIPPVPVGLGVGTAVTGVVVGATDGAGVGASVVVVVSGLFVGAAVGEAVTTTGRD